MKKTKTFVEIFAGAGGLSEGFIANGFHPVSCIEKDAYCCQTLRTRHAYFDLLKTHKKELYQEYLLGKIEREYLYKQIPKKHLDSIINEEINADTVNKLIHHIKDKLNKKPLGLLLGGPPCQAYSLIGRAQNKKKQSDERLYLYQYYLSFLKELKPTTFVFENVPGLLSINKGALFESIIEDFKKIGYFVSFKILNSNDFGVLQNRKRLIVVGNLQEAFNLDVLSKHKNKFHVNDILSDLIPLKPSDTNNQYIKGTNKYLLEHGIRKEEDILTLHQARPHNPRDLKIYQRAIELWNEKKERLKYSDLPQSLKTHKNEKSFLDRYKVVCSDSPASHTMVAHIAKDGHHYIHPDINQCRSISVREAARIQSFPDDFFFEGPRTAQFTQIGNAVPPLLSKTLANHIQQIL